MTHSKHWKLVEGPSVGCQVFHPSWRLAVMLGVSSAEVDGFLSSPDRKLPGLETEIDSFESTATRITWIVRRTLPRRLVVKHGREILQLDLLKYFSHWHNCLGMLSRSDSQKYHNITIRCEFCSNSSKHLCQHLLTVCPPLQTLQLSRFCLSLRKHNYFFASSACRRKSIRMKSKLPHVRLYNRPIVFGRRPDGYTNA